MFWWTPESIIESMHSMLPTGVVTFLLTDVEDSTDHWGRGDAATAMARQRQLISDAVSAGGVQPLEQGEGDSTVGVFVHPGDAIAAALEIQLAILAEDWPDAPVRVRVGVHTGDAQLVEGCTYGGRGIIRCARPCATPVTAVRCWSRRRPSR